jgi:4-amino-4-deoxy-L-arabinose transferase-like glycosyltransferase
MFATTQSGSKGERTELSQDKPVLFTRSDIFIFLGILVLFLILAAITLIRCYFIQPDSGYLLAIGKNIVTGHGPTLGGHPHYRYPLAYPALAGVFYLIIGNLEAAGHALSFVAGLGAITVVYIICARVYNRKTALIASLLLAINPLFISISTAALAEGLYAFAYAGFILGIFLLLKRPDWRLALLTGLVAGVVYLTRAEGFLFLPLGFAVLLIAWWRGKHRLILSGPALCLFLAGWLVLGFPYMLFLRHNLGGWAVSGKITQNLERISESIYSDNPEILHEVPLNKYKSPGLIPYVEENFPRIVERYVGFTGQAFKKAFIHGWPAILLFIWFIILALNDGTKRAHHFLILSIPILVYPLAHIETRYLTPTLVALTPPIAWGMYCAWEAGMKSSRLVILKRILVVLTVMLLAAGSVIAILKLSPPPFENRILADWMAENLPDSHTAKIAERFPYTSFYLENQNFMYIPEADTLDGVIAKAHNVNIKYLIIDQPTSAEANPLLKPLLDPDNAPDGIELLIAIEPSGAPGKIVLYRLK